MYFRSGLKDNHVRHNHNQDSLDKYLREKALNFQTQKKAFVKVRKALGDYFRQYDLSLWKMNKDYFKDGIIS